MEGSFFVWKKVLEFMGSVASRESSVCNRGNLVSSSVGDEPDLCSGEWTS